MKKSIVIEVTEDTTVQNIIELLFPDLRNVDGIFYTVKNNKPNVLMSMSNEWLQSKYVSDRS